MCTSDPPLSSPRSLMALLGFFALLSSACEEHNHASHNEAMDRQLPPVDQRLSTSSSERGPDADRAPDGLIDRTLPQDAVVDMETPVDLELPPSMSWRWSPPTAPNLTVELEGRPFSLRLFEEIENQEGGRQRRLRIHFDGSMLGFGFLNRLSDRKSYDPYWLHRGINGRAPSPPRDLRWLGIRAIERGEQVGEGAEARWVGALILDRGERATLTLSHRAGRAITLELAAADESRVAFGYFEQPIEEDENFYGLGESFDQVARRGTTRALNFQPLFGTESGYNEAHVPVPLLISTRGSGLFLESLQPSWFDVGGDLPDRV
ncbi:MAG: hypothetical protein VYD19_06940, partial [Myxococcota bacterium]|nr:hypothetical protein [Myxococcota bacterium]